MMSWQSWRQRRRAIREGQLLAREAKRGLRRYPALSEPARIELESAVRAFEENSRSASKDDDGTGRLVKLVNELDELLDKHLDFARKSTTREYIEAIVTAVVIALFLRNFVVEAFKIPSGSMIPTLQVGDHIFVNKFIYGVSFPYTDFKIGMDVRRPRRGEVIVFKFPKDKDKDFIKRIVATEGDTVQMKEGVLYVNDQPVEHAAVAGECGYEDYDENIDLWSDRRCQAVTETVLGNQYTTVYNRDREQIPGGPSNTSPTKVPPHSVFVMGDNRDNSHDSRFWGEVPENFIKGKAMVIWWSQGDPTREQGPESLSFLRNVPVLKYLWGARYTRMFSLVH